jgi:hypothetical protein
LWKRLQEREKKKRANIVATPQEIKMIFLTVSHKGIEFVLFLNVVPISTVEMGNLGISIFDHIV